jgi:hypothetical protein
VPGVASRHGVTVLVICDFFQGTILFEGADDVLSTLRSVTNGWRIRPAFAPGERPCVVVTGGAGEYVIWEDGREPIREPTAVSAACTLIVVLAVRMADEGEGLICLHAAAASVAGRTFVFPSTRRAGKSTLVAALAFAGHRMVADDLLPLEWSEARGLQAIAPGIAPRLRLPIPDALGSEFAAAADRQAGPQNKYYRYLKLPAACRASRGESFPIDAVILLDRRPGCKAELAHVPPGQGLRALLFQNFGRKPRPQMILARIGALISSTPSYRLRYDHPCDAVRILSGDLATLADRAPAGAVRIGTLPEGSRPFPPTRRRLHRRIGVERHERAGEAFLLDEATGAIFVLDPLGDALWELMATPISMDRLARLVGEAFPDVDPGTVRTDVSGFIGALWNSAVIAEFGS